MAPGQIRIQVESIGVNFPDALLVKGLYQAKPEVPFIPGLECAGTVEAVGEGVDHLAIGQRVAAMSPDFGTYAEYVSVPANHAYPVPASVDVKSCRCDALRLWNRVSCTRSACITEGRRIPADHRRGRRHRTGCCPIRASTWCARHCGLFELLKKS